MDFPTYNPLSTSSAQADLRHDRGTFEEFDDMEYLFDDSRMNHEDGFETSFNTNIPNTFSIEGLNSPAVDAILSAFLDPNQPATSYNYIEELEDLTVNLPVTNELPVMFPEPLQSFDNPGDPPQFAHILPLVPADTTRSGDETSVVKSQRYIHVTISELTPLELAVRRHFRGLKDPIVSVVRDANDVNSVENIDKRYHS